MNNTIWSIKDNKYIKYNGIKIEEPIQNNNYVGGKLWQYITHTMESELFLKIIKYIRKNNQKDKTKNLKISKRKIIENTIACIKKNERIMTRKDHKMHTFMSWIYITCLLHNIKINK